MESILELTIAVPSMGVGMNKVVDPGGGEARGYVS